MRVAIAYLKILALNELQYRINFFLQMLQSIVAVATGLFGISIIFDHTTNVAGWTQYELIAVIGVFTLVGGFIGSFVAPNTERLINEVGKGDFDYALTKPVDAQILASVREFKLWKLSDVLVGLAVVIWAAVKLNPGPGAVDLPSFALTIVVGAILIYCVWFMVATFVFWFIRMDMLHELFTGLYRAGLYPVTAYPSWLRYLLTYLVPLGFAITVPAEVLTGRITTGTAAAMGIAVGVAVVATRAVWLRGVKRYDGASA